MAGSQGDGQGGRAVSEWRPCLEEHIKPQAGGDVIVRAGGVAGEQPIRQSSPQGAGGGGEGGSSSEWRGMKSNVPEWAGPSGNRG